jgi:nickel-dependent lactate racemase
MMYVAEGNADTSISLSRVSELIDSMLGKLGKLDRVLLLPPDLTRYLSGAGEITSLLYEKLKNRSHISIMPAVGTHTPMTAGEISIMFPGIPHEHFIRHDWQKDVIVMGTVPPDITSKLTGRLVDWPIHCEVNRILAEGHWDQIISIGQLMPHELIGIANHNKNIMVGTGGKDIIGKTHMIGALYGTEKMMGHISSPVRNVLNYMSEHFLRHLPISYIMTVRATLADDRMVTRGIFAGNDEECYLQGARLCQQVNITLLNKEYKKVVAWLDPEEFKSVWVGNKALLRTQMCIADGGELIILCAGIQSFGENEFADSFIRKYGYRDPEELLQIVRNSGELMEYLVPLSQMVISYTKRFKLIYAAKKITRQEIESVYCNYADYDEVVKKYDPSKMQEGENIIPDGEEVFYVSKPAQGLWAEINRFKQNE